MTALNLAADPSASEQADIEKTAALWIAEGRAGKRTKQQIERELTAMASDRADKMRAALNKYRQIKPVKGAP